MNRAASPDRSPPPVWRERPAVAALRWAELRLSLAPRSSRLTRALTSPRRSTWPPSRARCRGDPRRRGRPRARPRSRCGRCRTLSDQWPPPTAGMARALRGWRGNTASLRSSHRGGDITSITIDTNTTVTINLLDTKTAWLCVKNLNFVYIVFKIACPTRHTGQISNQ